MPTLPDPRDPLQRMLAAQQFSDSEMRTLLRDSAKEAARLASAAGTGFGGDMRRAQLEIAQAQQKMWEKVGYQAKINIGDGVDAAADSAAHMMDTYLESMGVGTVGMRQAMMMQGRAGIESLVSKRGNGIPLSQQVYKTSVESGQQLDRTINALIVNGASAREIASRVRQFIDPATPGGASYAAMRLGRTELNNAFHSTSRRLNQENPFVEGMLWNLSGSHPRPDACNDYAEDEHFPGGDPGLYKPDNVPDKPHPQCLCYISPEVVNDDDFIKNFKSGQYDSYLDDQLGVGRVGSSLDVGDSNITHLQARDAYSAVRKEMPGLTDSAYRREAARRTNTDYDTFLQAWKKPTKPAPDVLPPIPRPLPPEPYVPPTVPILPAPVTPNIPLPIDALTHEAARAEFKLVKKLFPDLSEADARRHAAERLGADYKDYLKAWKKPSAVNVNIPQVPRVPQLVSPTTHKGGWELKKVDGGQIVGRQATFEGVGADIDGVNPWFRVGHDWQNNCPSTTSSFEMKRRGFDVTAVPMKNGATLREIYRAWNIELHNQIGVPNHVLDTLSGYNRNAPYKIFSQTIPMHTGGLPNGARGFISVDWKNGSAHIYNWEKINGEIRYFDAQNGVMYSKDAANARFFKAKPEVYMTRVDDLLTPPGHQLDWLVRNKHDSDIVQRDRLIEKRAEASAKRRQVKLDKQAAERAARQQDSYTSWAFDQLSAADKATTKLLPGENPAKYANRLARERSRVYYDDIAKQRQLIAERDAAAKAVDLIDSQALRDALSQAEKARISLERGRFTNGNLNKSKGWTTETHDALTRYTEGSVVDMNMIKRDPARYFNSIPKLGPHPSVAARMNHAGAERVVKDVERLEDLIKKNALDRDVTVARGVTTDMSHLNVGELFADPAFLSTTTDLRMADDFATGRGGKMTRSGRKQEGWTFVMRAKRGTNAVAGADYQSEIVFGPGLKQRIMSIDRVKRIIYSEVI